jgi:16S rRNA (adenine(1408)-N(1))-methyltransferase
LHVAVDANAGGLLSAASKAARKPARGGVPNLICLAERAETLADELGAVASRMTVILPWSSLLRTVAMPDTDSLRKLSAVCLSGASFEIVFSYDGSRDAGRNAPLAFAAIDEYHVSSLAVLYQEAGLNVDGIQRISLDELKEYDTTWANRLGFGCPREVWRIRGRKAAPG